MSQTQDAAPSLAAKEALLHRIIRRYERVAVAFSGGVDSSYLLAACVDVLGAQRVLALTADSPLLPRAELSTAREIAAHIGVEHRVIPFDDLAVPEVAANVVERCYYCKRARFEALMALVGASGGAQLLHGENADDHLDFRPGARAAQELGVRAPLAEAGLTKVEIREISRRRGLPTWNHPAAACLATRFPPDTRLTREALERVERAEEYLRELGLGQVRVRDHFPVARIETPAEDIARVTREDVRSRASAALRSFGYRYVTVDLDGYRMGSMNDQPRKPESK